MLVIHLKIKILFFKETKIYLRLTDESEVNHEM